MILLTGDFPGSSRPRLGSADRQVAGLWPGDWAEVTHDACEAGLDICDGRQEILGSTSETDIGGRQLPLLKSLSAEKNGVLS